MIHISHQLVHAVSFAISDSDSMLDNEFTNNIKFTLKNGESIDLDQRRVRIRENNNGLMAISYLAPFFETMDLENFFEEVLTSEELSMNIADTGDFTVRFRGMVEGKGKELPENLAHKIILLQEPVNLDPRENIRLKGFSRFKLRDEISEN